MNAVIAFANTALAVTLIYYLWNQRSGFVKTDSVVQRLVMYTIGTGFATSLWGILALVFGEVLPTSFAFLIFDLTFPKRK